MLLSDTAVKRPVFASVIALILVILGVVSFDRLSLREYPDIDAPIVTIDTRYPGASASVVETRITQIVEDRIAGVEGIRFINQRPEVQDLAHQWAKGPANFCCPATCRSIILWYLTFMKIT